MKRVKVWISATILGRPLGSIQAIQLEDHEVSVCGPLLTLSRRPPVDVTMGLRDMQACLFHNRLYSLCYMSFVDDGDTPLYNQIELVELPYKVTGKIKYYEEG